ncbi:hypothetical protein CEY04_25365 [Achromobacter sp. HZ28]|nr:hypothetical protein CEY05_26530 [Achromobacter sp. HZ34]OWT71925.1 hypothetical protein CEY04_25365 [Achromobacter sp. HZ28]
MLQVFLDRLDLRWGTSTDWIIVIANALWNGAEIDLVCILPSAILVADFKSHDGRLIGTENGPWQADGAVVKGGRKDNPYQQLRDNKFSVLNWLQSKSLLTGRNLGHISAGVVFGGDIEDHLELPAKVRSWFYPTNLNNCTALLDRLASPELHIDPKEAQDIIHQLGVQPVEWLSSHPKVRDIGQEPFKPLPRTLLTAHQHEALQTLTNFVSTDGLITFSVLGMTSTGKSRLLATLVSEIQKSRRTPIVLAPNRRLAVHAPVEAESIYAHLFGGVNSQGKKDDVAKESAEPDVIPMRLCEDDEDAVYLLDDAHLLSNSRFTTPDRKQYGSGHLLDDFCDFTELGSGKRKAIFFGDPYQIQRSGDNDSALLGQFQKSRELKHQFLELSQVIDTTGGSAKLANAERLVKAIRSERFAELDLLKDEGFRQADRQTAASEILERYRSDPSSVWYLAETHAKANALTVWVRERLHGKKRPMSLEPGDLLEIYVSGEDKDFGGRRLVTSVGLRETYEQPLKGRDAQIVFHSMSCSLDKTEHNPVDVFEEFLVSERPELSADIAIAEWVRRKSETLPPLPAFAYVRYGYASTVHHAQGMSQAICYVNCDHAAGHHSEGFFRWLYSALTVPERELVLVNFTDIQPYDSAVWKTAAVSVAADIPIGAGWSFQPNGIASEQDQQRSVPPGLEESKDFHKSLAIWLRIAKAAQALGWHVAKAACHSYQEQYDLVGPKGELSRLRIAYNGKNVVTAIHVNDSAHWSLLASLAAECLQANGYSPEVESLLTSARSRLGPYGWKIVSATEAAYRLHLVVARDHEERVSIEINFGKQGLVSSLRPLHTSNLALLDEIKEALL